MPSRISGASASLFLKRGTLTDWRAHYALPYLIERRLKLRDYSGNFLFFFSGQCLVSPDLNMKLPNQLEAGGFVHLLSAEYANLDCKKKEIFSIK